MNGVLRVGGRLSLASTAFEAKHQIILPKKDHVTNLVVEYYHQYLADIFWKRWSKEYLPLLQKRQKWTTIRKNLAVGDIVLVSAENSPRNSWPLGRVVEVFADKKGLVRRTRVKVKGAVLERPIDKLCSLIEA